MKGLLVTLSSDFISQAMRIHREEEMWADLVTGKSLRWNHGKWKKRDRAEAREQRGQHEDTTRTWASRVERKRRPDVIFRQASLTSLTHTCTREQFKLTLVCDRGKDDLEDPAILQAQQHQSPKVSHPTHTLEHTPPTGRSEDVQAARETLGAAEGESALQSPASVSGSCQASSMCSRSCRVIARKDETEGHKERSAAGSECQVGRWALGPSRPIRWAVPGAVADLGELPHRALR